MYWTVHLKGGPRRVNHAAVLDGDKIFTFGGYCSGENYIRKRPMDVFILNTETLRWTALPVAKRGCPQYGVTPYQRYGHSAVVYGKNIYIWGGRNDRLVCNKLFCFNTLTFEWSCPNVSGTIPVARDGHSACVYGDKMYIFGGYIDEEHMFAQDVFALDLNTFQWSDIRTTGVPPSYRDFHTANVINGKMYVFGGRGEESEGALFSSREEYPTDIVYLDMCSKTWIRPTPSGLNPVGRRSHSAFVYKDHLYIFGGYNGIADEHFNDIFCYCTNSNKWWIVCVNGDPPTKRRRQSCIMNGDRLIIFGGSSPLSALDKQTREKIEAERPYMGTQSNEMNGENFGESNLVDNDDLHILDFNPSLKTISMLEVIKNKINTKHLPFQIKRDLQNITTNNTIVRENTKTG